MEINRLHRARLRAEASGPLLDLTDTNFGRAGLHPPEEAYEHAFAAWRSQPAYAASARGSETTRAAVADWYRTENVTVDLAGVMLTAGSTLSYHLLFSTILDGGAPLLAQPGYPLFEEICAMHGIQPLHYALDRDANWRIDRSSLKSAMGQDPGCIVIVSPNNPCGTLLEADELEWVCRLAAEKRIPVIADEVFAAFVDRLTKRRAPSALEHARSTGATVYAINGLSKNAAAPEVKLGWIATAEPDSAQWASLELAHDAYLSVSTFAEHFGTWVLREGRPFLDELSIEVGRRRREYRRWVAAVPGLRAYPPQAGIHAILAIDRDRALIAFGTDDDEEIAIQLVERQRLFIHPGYLYGIEADDPHFVISYLSGSERVAEGITRIGAALRRTT